VVVAHLVFGITTQKCNLLTLDVGTNSVVHMSVSLPQLCWWSVHLIYKRLCIKLI